MITQPQARMGGILILVLLMGLTLLPTPSAQAATLYRFRRLNTNLCVQDNGTNAVLATCQNINAQKWSLTGLPNSVYVPRSQSSSKCLGVNNANTGTPVVMLSCSNPPATNIRWYIQGFAPNRFLAHTMLNTGKCIQANSSALNLADCNTSAAQWFEMIQTS